MPNTIKGASASQCIGSASVKGIYIFKPLPDYPTGAVTVHLGQCQIVYGKRYLLTAKVDGTPDVREIPMNVAIASLERYLEMISEDGGAYVDSADLERFILAAQRELEKRRAVLQKPVLAREGWDGR